MLFLFNAFYFSTLILLKCFLSFFRWSAFLLILLPLTWEYLYMRMYWYEGVWLVLLFLLWLLLPLTVISQSHLLAATCWILWLLYILLLFLCFFWVVNIFLRYFLFYLHNLPVKQRCQLFMSNFVFLENFLKGNVFKRLAEKNI